MNAKISTVVMIVLAFCCSRAFGQTALAPLAEAQLQATITQLRQAVSPTPAPSAPAGGERITLTPNKPMAGNNYFELSKGSNSAMTNLAGSDPTGAPSSSTVPGGPNRPAAGVANRSDMVRRSL